MPAGAASTQHALFPGTFDPPTSGHLDLIRRAARLFERLTVVLAANPQKHELLPAEERLELLRAITGDLGNVAVERFDGLVVEACRQLGAGVLVRGLRHTGDFDYEAQMARTNAALAPEVETVFLVAAPSHVHVSGTLVRQVATLGGDASKLVPPAVGRALGARFAPGARKP